VILRRLRVPSFAGLVDAELELSPGLNVILGPNETGKSTLFQALAHTLLTPARLTRPRFQRTVEPYLPAGGGDTIESELDFAVAEQTYRLRKRWGATPEVELELPDGARLTGEEAVQDRIRELLPVDEATMRAVLLTYQAGLADTLRGLSEHPEAVHGLSDLLRRSLLESDGVSTGRFRDLLERRIAETLGHWDTERRQPEDGRGWDHPWKKGVGSVLQAYYEQQALEAAHQAALDAERSYEERSRLLESSRERLRELSEGLEAEAPAAADAERRDALEARREAAAVRLEAAQKAYAEWTESLLVRERSQEERTGLVQSLGALEAEQAEVELHARSRRLRERHARARELKQRWEAALERLQGTPAVAREQIEELRGAAAQLQRLEGAVSGGALSLRLEARDSLEVTASRDLEHPEQRKLEARESWELAAGSRIRLEHRDWSLEVTSGDPSFGDVAQGYQAARVRLEGLLRAAGVPSLEAAEQTRSQHERCSLEAQAARRAFEEALNGQTWEALEEAIRELPPQKSLREAETVMSELAETKARLGRIDESLRRTGERIASLEDSHQSREALLGTIGEHTARLQELERQLSGLQALPEEYADAASFLEQHRAREREAQVLREQSAGLESALQEALRHLPEETAEELAVRLDGARLHFQRQERRGLALLKVREAADAILGSLEDSSMEGFRDRFGEYVRELSADRYRGGAAGELVPEALERSDGLTLHYPLLSAGTRDLFSLALRLAMAEYLLAGSVGDDTGGDRSVRRGFLVMDDPLVDMDPERQRLAAAVMARFARSHQMVVFTCHPAHAEILIAADPDRDPPARRIELTRV